MLFYGALEKCPVCGSNLECAGKRYSCKGSYSEWSTCTFSTTDPPRKEEPIKLPESVLNSAISDVPSSSVSSFKLIYRSLFLVIGVSVDLFFTYNSC